MKNDARAIELLIGVDKSFTGYDLEFPASQAPNAATAIGRPDLAGFITELNKFMWPEQPAPDAYTIRIGRRFDTQGVTIDLFKGFYPDVDRIVDETRTMAMRHGAVRSEVEPGPMGTEIRVWWERNEGRQ